MSTTQRAKPAGNAGVKRWHRLELLVLSYNKTFGRDNFLDDPEVPPAYAGMTETA
jgi:hypothetical protein